MPDKDAGYPTIDFMRRAILSSLATCLVFGTCIGQVAVQFDTIINLPPDSMPEQIESNTQINILPGGDVPDWFDLPVASPDIMNVEVNLDGGTIGRGFEAPAGTVTYIRSGEIESGFRAESGSVVSLYGGTIGPFFTAESGSQVTVSGGNVGSRFLADSGSTVVVSGGAFADAFWVDPEGDTTMVGADFRVNGIPVTGFHRVGDTVRIDMSGETGTTLSGVFSDGSPFVFAVDDSDLSSDGTSLALRLARVPEPGPAMLDAAMDPLPLGIRSGQMLVVGAQGTVPDNFTSIGGSILVSGGAVGGNLEVLDSNVEILSGTIGGAFDAFGMSNVVMTGGLFAGSLELHPNSSLELSGGVWGRDIHSKPGSAIELFGGEFHLNGTAISDLDEVGSRRHLEWTESDIVSGVLADGTPFLLPYQEGTVTLASAALPAIGPEVINAATDPIPAGIRGGQTLIVETGAVVPGNFRAGGGSVVEIRGGTVHRGFQAIEADVHVQGGVVEGGIHSYGGRVVIDGGEVPIQVESSHGTQIEVNAGAVSGLSLLSGNDGIVRGGRIRWIRVLSDSQLRLTGGDFRLSGELIEGLEVDGNALAIDVPEYGTITGTLSDGSPFALVRDDGFGDGYIVPGGLILEKAPLPPPDPRVFNAPADAVPLVLKEGQTLVVEDGATVPMQFIAGRGSTIEVQGGSIGRFLRAAGAVVNVQDGRIEADFDALDGTMINVSGGTIEQEMSLVTGSVLNVAGGIVWSGLEAFKGTTVNMSGGEMHGLDVWDGSVFNMTGGVLQYRTNALPGGTINISGGESQGTVSLAHDTVLNLSGGRHQHIGGTGVVNVTGDVYVESLGISEFFGNSGELFMSGGCLNGESPLPSDRQRVNVSGTAHITGGRIGANTDLYFLRHGKGFISGGVLGGKLIAAQSSDVTIQGTTLRFDGKLVSSSMEPGDRMDLGFYEGPTVISGTLADGAPFIYSTHNGDRLSSENVHFELVEGTSDRPSVAELPHDPVPLGAGAGQTVVVGPGADVYSGFLAGWDSTLMVAGGMVGDRLRASGSRVVVESGSIGDTFHAYHGTTVELHGGSIGDDFSAFEDSTVIVRGGSIGEGFHAYPLANVHWYGGDLGESFVVDEESTLHVYGTDFHLDEQALDLTLGETRQLTGTATLTATLADGSRPAISVGRIDENLGSALTVAITHISTIPGDFNNNGLVEQSDLDQVLVHWGESLDRPWNDGWINDLPIGIIDQAELDKVLVNWGRTSGTALSQNLVPEPGTFGLICAVAAAGAAFASRRRLSRLSRRAPEPAS